MTVKTANLVRLDIANLAIGATSATLSTPSEGSQLPDDLPYHIEVYDRDTPDPIDQLALVEIIRVTAHNKGAGTLDTIVRGQHGTTDQNHTTGTPCFIIAPLAQSAPSVFNLQEYGGFPGAPAATNDTAIVDALAAIKLAGEGVLYIPQGSWTFAAVINADNISNLQIRGDGEGITILTFTDTGGILVDNSDASADPLANRVFLKDFTITDSGTGTASTGIHFKAHVRKGGISNVRVTGFGLHLIHVQGGEHLAFNEVYWSISRVITGDLILCEDGIGAARIARHHTWTAGNTDRNESSGLAFHMKGIMGFQATAMEFYNAAGVQGRAILCEPDGVEEFRGSFNGVHLRSGYTTRADDFKFLNVYRPLISDIIVDTTTPLAPQFIYDAAWAATLGFTDTDKRHATVIQGGVNPAGTAKPSAYLDSILLEDVENVPGPDGTGVFLRCIQGTLGIRNDNNSTFGDIQAKVLLAKIDGITGGFKAGLIADVQFYRSAADTWRTPDSLIIDTSLVVSGLTNLAGGIRHDRKTQTTGTLSLGDLDTLIICDTSSGDVTLNLPSAATRDGAKFYIIKTSPANDVIIVPNGAAKINGLATNYILQKAYKLITIFTDATDWYTDYNDGIKKLTSADSPYSVVQYRDQHIFGDTVTASITAHLPEFPSPGDEYFFKKTPSASNSFIIDTTGAPLIDGAASVTLNSNNSRVLVVSDGTDYFMKSPVT